MRTITISDQERPRFFPEDAVWITTSEDVSIVQAIRVAMRMRPHIIFIQQNGEQVCIPFEEGKA